MLNKTVISFFLSFILLVSFTNSSSAQALSQDMMGVEAEEELHDDSHETLNEILPELLEEYNKDTIQELDCAELTESEFERVGDAAMESRHSGKAHERMDEMMGGEGSESLSLAHIKMGQNYLGCKESFSSKGMMGFFGTMQHMGGGAKSMFWGDSQMMGGNSLFGSGFGLLWIVNSILVTVFLVVLIRYFWKRGGGKK